MSYLIHSNDHRLSTHTAYEILILKITGTLKLSTHNMWEDAIKTNLGKAQRNYVEWTRLNLDRRERRSPMNSATIIRLYMQIYK